jgi:DNA-binding transcriptional ArsR family regulator
MAQLFASAIDEDACDTECLHPATVRPLLGRTLTPDGALVVAGTFATLADPSRSRIVHLLAIGSGELCVCDIALVLGMSVSALSHQLRTLHERGVVARRKHGRVVFYQLIDERVRQLILDGAGSVAEGAA